jgi:hypothetical protein
MTDSDLMKRLKELRLGACPELGNYVSFPLPDWVIDEVIRLENKSNYWRKNFDLLADTVIELQREIDFWEDIAKKFNSKVMEQYELLKQAYTRPYPYED